MSNLTSLSLTSGAPTNSGTISTLDALMADGGQATIGAIADAAVSTDANGTVNAHVRGLVKIFAASLAVAGALFHRITDGTNTAAVKAASTAPVAGDPALVVAISPNSVNGNGQATMANGAPITVASNQSTLSVALDTTQIANGASGTMVTPTKVKISIASATTTTLVALVATKKIRVLSMYLISTGANTVNLQSHVTTSNSDGLPGYAANGGIVLPFNPIGWFDTTAGEALDMVTSGSGQVSGQLSYVAV